MARRLIYYINTITIKIYGNVKKWIIFFTVMVIIYVNIPLESAENRFPETTEQWFHLFSSVMGPLYQCPSRRTILCTFTNTLLAKFLVLSLQKNIWIMYYYVIIIIRYIQNISLHITRWIFLEKCFAILIIHITRRC